MLRNPTLFIELRRRRLTSTCVTASDVAVGWLANATRFHAAAKHRNGGATAEGATAARVTYSREPRRTASSSERVKSAMSGAPGADSAWQPRMAAGAHIKAAGAEKGGCSSRAAVRDRGDGDRDAAHSTTAPSCRRVGCTSARGTWKGPAAVGVTLPDAHSAVTTWPACPEITTTAPLLMLYDVRAGECIRCPAGTPAVSDLARGDAVAHRFNVCTKRYD